MRDDGIQTQHSSLTSGFKGSDTSLQTGVGVIVGKSNTGLELGVIEEKHESQPTEGKV